MSKAKKHCDTCAHSYYTREQKVTRYFGKWMQHCKSPDYNSLAYTHRMLLNDWDKGCCRYWMPKERRGI